MVQIIEGKPSSASQFMSALGQGAQSGMQTGANYAMQLGLQNAKIKQKQALFDAIRKGGTKTPVSSLIQAPEQMDQEFIEALNEKAPELEQQMGRELTPQDLNNLWSQYSGSQTQSQEQNQTSAFSNMTPDEKLQLALAFPTEFNAMAQGERAGIARDTLEFQKQKFGKQQEFAREEKAQEPIKEIRDRLKTGEMSGMRFSRLNELFTPEFEDKFPPNFAVGLMTKDGDLRPTAMALLSPEAQESVKLVYDEMTGAKDTYGARVTNFDAAQYLKRLPSLLNSPDGRRRVLKDLNVINEINQLHDRELLNIVDERGGAGKISMDKAEAVFDKRFGKQKKDLQKLFISADKAVLNEMPPAHLLKGRKLKDPDTGQTFISDGKEWIPQ